MEAETMGFFTYFYAYIKIAQGLGITALIFSLVILTWVGCIRLLKGG